MLLKVNPHKIEIDKSPVNEREINISKCEFEFADEITSDYVKEAYFTFKGTTYKQIIVNDECDFPSEVLTEKGQVKVGVVAYLVEDETEIKRYNPSPAYFNTWDGSLVDNAENSEPVTPTDKEQMEQILQTALNDIAEAIENAERLDVDATKTGNTATITITKQDGSQVVVNVLDGVDGTDGVSLQYNWSGTYLGIKREDQTNYDYVNLKGDPGEPGQIEFIVVNELPQTGREGTIYLVPLDTPETEENNYAEYIYVNNNWELLGKIGVHIDLSNYYTKQEVNNLLPTHLSDLADDSTHRTVTDTEKTTWNNKSDFSGDYNDLRNKPTIPSKTSDLTNDSDFTTKTYVDGLVGDINTALDSINGEVI